jgi:spore coat protein U-like protein
MNVSVKGAVAGAALMLAGAMSTAQAQATPATASITATAVVQQALVAAKVQDLDFGATFGGIARTVLPSDVTSGEVGLTGSPNAEVTVSFTTLPAILTGPGANIPLTYGASAAAYNVAGTRAGATAFDPATGSTTRLNNATGLLSIYLGGTVSPAANQAAGTYTNTITLSAAYTGN